LTGTTISTWQAPAGLVISGPAPAAAGGAEPAAAPAPGSRAIAGVFMTITVAPVAGQVLR
jgi:hypothetical protein